MPVREVNPPSIFGILRAKSVLGNRCHLAHEAHPVVEIKQSLLPLSRSFSVATVRRLTKSLRSLAPRP